ncbi:hypothetical protein RHGRI_029869 [Rhododendron griersonianum]|uniref:4-alpha-glucanotransferase n=1 Tax=Rhododendron griersonianum TaxID=479676 RepID=A0AAV6IRX5_9ERIC|nr:hypothetical protein RHGRI_029869 [Rhododendron griersonianum]
MLTLAKGELTDSDENSPLYDWKAMERYGFSWWTCRIGRAQDLFDEFRIDHFRGFAGFWAVPSGELELKLKLQWSDDGRWDLESRRFLNVEKLDRSPQIKSWSSVSCIDPYFASDSSTQIIGGLPQLFTEGKLRSVVVHFPGCPSFEKFLELYCTVVDKKAWVLNYLVEDFRVGFGGFRPLMSSLAFHPIWMLIGNLS